MSILAKLWCKLRGCHNWRFERNPPLSLTAPCAYKVTEECACCHIIRVVATINVFSPHVHKWSRGYKNPHIGTSAYGHMPYIKHCTLDECIAIAPVKRRKVAKELP